MAETELSEAGDRIRRRRRVPLSRAVYGDVVQFIDFGLIVLWSIVIAIVYHEGVRDFDFDIQRYAAAGIVAATAVTAILRRDGFYDFDRLLDPTRIVRAVTGRWLLVLLGVIAFGFALKVSESFSRAWLAGWAVIGAASLVATRLGASAILRRAVRDGGVFARRVAIVGVSDAARQFADMAAGSGRAITIVGVFNVGEADVGGADGDVASLEAAARAGEVDDIVITQTDVSRDFMDALVRRLSILPCSIAIAPSAHWFDHMGGEIVRIGGAPLLSLYRRPLEGWGGLIKSLEDKILGGFLCIATLPLMAIVALALRLQGNGPIIFSQQRHGFNNSVFRIYKFRTMTVEEDGEEISQARPGDSRITPLGRILRRYSIDELPQLFNVLKGDMSLVGPRPHALAHNHVYARVIEHYSGRHKVKPGITGWAQVNGCRGETSENEMMEQRVRYDLAYIDNWSIFFDLKILALTVIAVLFPRNAY